MTLSELQKQITAYQGSLLKHALGLNYQEESYRNYFSASEGHSDTPDWRKLVQLGLATERPSPFSSDILFMVTEQGKKVAKTI